MRAHVLLLLILAAGPSFSQVGINTTGAPPDPSALLDLSSSSQGLLMPRMTVSERDGIPSPAEGLQIFNTTSKCFEAFVNGGWYVVSCPMPCAAPNTPGFTQFPTNVCAFGTATFTAEMVPNAISYTWTVPPSATINSGQGTTEVSITFGEEGGNVCVKAFSALCGFSAENCNGVSIQPLPGNVGAVSGPTVVCQGNTYSFSVEPVIGVSWYNWALPPGAAIATGDYSPNVEVYFDDNSASGQIVVTPTSECGTGGLSPAYNVSVLAMPEATGGSDITSSSFTATWNAAAGATGYELDVLSAPGVYVPGYENLGVGNVTSYSVAGLGPDIVYTYRVRAVHGDCTSGHSEARVWTRSSCSGNVGDPGCPGLSCLDVLQQNPGSADGAYWIDPDGPGGGSSFQAYCDMTTDGGGWTYAARGPNLSTAAFGPVTTDPNTEVSWHLSESAVRNLYNNTSSYEIYTWSNTFDGDRIRIFRPQTPFSLTMSLAKVWNGTSFVQAGGGLGSFGNGPHCVLRSNIYDMIPAQSNMHWGFNGATTNYLRCVQEAHGPTNGLLFVR